MRRADRLFQIVQLLRGGRLTTAARLAERLEVSERTIYRDIADLQASGVPVDGAAVPWVDDVDPAGRVPRRRNGSRRHLDDVPLGDSRS